MDLIDFLSLVVLVGPAIGAVIYTLWDIFSKP